MHVVQILRAETEPDNFCCSHRCLLSGTLVRGAFVLVTRARPDCSPLDLLGLLACPSIDSFTPIAGGLVFSEHDHLLFCPNAQANARNEHFFGGRYLFFSNPVVQSVSLNSQFLCRLRHRVLAHFDIAHTCSICQVETEARRHSLRFFRTQLKTIASLEMNRKYCWVSECSRTELRSRGRALLDEKVMIPVGYPRSLSVTCFSTHTGTARFN